jgi:hypothetical protein
LLPQDLILTINWVRRLADKLEEAMQAITPVSQHSDNIA